jgi:hypothetical protein
MSRNIPWSNEDDRQLRGLAVSGFRLAEIAHQMVSGKSSVCSRALKIEVAIALDRNPEPRKTLAAVEIGLKAKK